MAETIQFRNVPDDVHLALRTAATAAGKFFSEYVEEVAARPRNAEIFRLAAERGGGISREAIVAAVRSGRNR